MSLRPPAAAAAPRCVGDRCATWNVGPLHNVHHAGVFIRVCSSCVLMYHPGAFCSACLLLIPHDAAAYEQTRAVNPVLAPPAPTAACSACRQFVAHVACLPDGDAAAFVCRPCAAAAQDRPFSFDRPGRLFVDEGAARLNLVAAWISHQSMRRAAAAAQQAADRAAMEAAVARNGAREKLDEAFRLAEAEGSVQATAPAAAEVRPKQRKKKASKSESSRKASSATRSKREEDDDAAGSMLLLSADPKAKGSAGKSAKDKQQ